MILGCRHHRKGLPPEDRQTSTHFLRTCESMACLLPGIFRLAKQGIGDLSTSEPCHSANKCQQGLSCKHMHITSPHITQFHTHCHNTPEVMAPTPPSSLFVHGLGACNKTVAVHTGALALADETSGCPSGLDRLTTPL